MVVVGDIKTSQFNSKKGKLAKSVYDAAWFELKRQLEYKCKHAGCRFEIVNEKYTTQTCSCCGDMSSGPKGRAGLAIREWTCAKCSTWHDSDLMPVRTFLRPSLTVWEQESPHFRAGRKSSAGLCLVGAMLVK